MVAALTSHGLGPNIPRWVFVSLLGLWGAFYIKPGIGLICLIYAAASLLWTPDWREGMDIWFGMIALYGAYTLFQRDRHLPEAVTVAVIVTGFLYLSNDHVYWAGFGNENFLVEFLTISIPFVWMAWGRARIWMTIACSAASLTIACILSTTGSDTFLFVLGATALWICWVLIRRRWYWTASFLFAGLVNAGCFMWNAAIWQSVSERMELTINTLAMWTRSPIFGNGIGSFNYLYPEYQEFHSQWLDGTALHSVLLFAGAAHNEYAQALAEFGIVGVGLFASFLIGHRITAPVFLVGVIALIAFPLQNPATALLFAGGLGLSQWHVQQPRSWQAASLFLPMYTFLQRRLL